MTRAIFFDIDNTLVDREAAFDRYLGDLARRFPSLAGVEAQRRIGELDDGGGAPRPAFCEAVVSCFPELDMSAGEFWKDFAGGLVRAVEPRPALTERLSRVALRYRLAAVSNGSGRRQREKLRRAGLDGLVTACFVSEEVGACKPDPRIFHHALAATGLGAEEVLFVGDDPVRDIGGARAAGLSSCWISRGRPYPEPDGHPDMTFAGVEDLLDALLEGTACAT